MNCQRSNKNKKGNSPLKFIYQTKVFEYLEFKDLLNCRLVCREWKMFLNYFPLQCSIYSKSQIFSIFPHCSNVIINEISTPIISILNTTKWLQSLSIRHMTQESCNLLSNIDLKMLTYLEIFFSNATYLNINNLLNLKKLMLYDFPSLLDNGLICNVETLKTIKLSSIPYFTFKNIKKFSPYIKEIELINMPKVGSKTIQQFNHFKKLKKLIISDNDELTDSILKKNLKNIHLEHLTISDCSGLEGSFISDLPPLKKLTLTFNKSLDNKCLCSYNYYDKIESLDLFGSSIIKIPSFPNLKRLSIGYTNTHIFNLTHLTMLKSLDLTYLKLTDTDLDQITILTGLITLNLSFNTLITNSGLIKIISSCKQLQAINLARCTLITSIGIRMLNQLKNLQFCVLPNFMKIYRDQLFNEKNLFMNNEWRRHNN
ncbi:F-box/leucine rich repeat protein, putative [Entamoeba dispar SAW760]|uniref:F-box/leucine rich repeat protein, putative n=1 Tax=Entamoeba dispar (strain ATCC PRA-260 / SAW760) TaxID=370354 RepID=B0EQE3_ENTDS|nr:F-box/leucine rich repeat protein, putative [Entamoeba dispar SAW760]EDR23268.1 F-box/leucine rich repeat protein, putative [Entamoeba dispar SAW760]|eukprot:EDR23268.1 F-box/leucine rich repeat protein, putative [Entamoeba dispar SAW760]